VPRHNLGQHGLGEVGCAEQHQAVEHLCQHLRIRCIAQTQQRTSAAEIPWYGSPGYAVMQSDPVGNVRRLGAVMSGPCRHLRQHLRSRCMAQRQQHRPAPEMPKMLMAVM
jgi:hypothetical protein